MAVLADIGALNGDDPATRTNIRLFPRSWECMGNERIGESLRQVLSLQ
jgi:hypothetical protein